MKSKIIKTLIACVIVAAVAVGGYYGYNKFFAAKPTKTTSQYLTMTARKMNMSVTIQGTGAAYAAVTKDVMANNAGTLKDLNVKVGDTVAAGAKLFTSDSDDLRKNITSAQNSLNKQNLTLSSDQASLANDQAKLAADIAAANSTTPSQSGGQSNQGGQNSVDPQAKVTSDQNAVTNDKNKISMDQLSINDAQSQLTYANQQLSKAVVTAPIGGVITAVNNTNGDSLSPNKAVLSIVDMSSLKIKVQVDELDIEKVKIGQKAQILFDAIKGKNYEGTVETIAQTGTTSNNVTTYDVVVDITDPTGIKIGMNANVTIQVDSKDNVLTIPTEALIDMNGQKFVLVPNASGTTSTSGTQSSSNNNQNTSGNNQAQQGNNQGGNNQNRNAQGGNGQSRRTGTTGTNSNSFSFAGNGKRVRVQTGLENESNVEITQGLNEGDKVLVQLPQTSTTTNNRNAAAGGFGGGNFGGGNFGGGNRQGGGNSAARGD